MYSNKYIDTGSEGMRQTLGRLNPQEADRLCNQLLSQNVEDLGLTSDQALDVLQVLEESPSRRAQTQFPIGGQAVDSFPNFQQSKDFTQFTRSGSLFGAPTQTRQPNYTSGLEPQQQHIAQGTASVSQQFFAQGQGGAGSSLIVPEHTFAQRKKRPRQGTQQQISVKGQSTAGVPQQQTFAARDSTMNEMLAITEKVEMLERQRAQILFELNQETEQLKSLGGGSSPYWCEPDMKRKKMTNENKSHVGNQSRGGIQKRGQNQSRGKNQARGQNQQRGNRGRRGNQQRSQGGNQTLFGNQGRGGGRKQSNTDIKLQQNRGGTQANRARGGKQNRGRKRTSGGSFTQGTERGQAAGESQNTRDGSYLQGNQKGRPATRSQERHGPHGRDERRGSTDTLATEIGHRSRSRSSSGRYQGRRGSDDEYPRGRRDNSWERSRDSHDGGPDDFRSNTDAVVVSHDDYQQSDAGSYQRDFTRDDDCKQGFDFDSNVNRHDRKRKRRSDISQDNLYGQQERHGDHDRSFDSARDVEDQSFQNQEGFEQNRRGQRKSNQKKRKKKRDYSSQQSGRDNQDNFQNDQEEKSLDRERNRNANRSFELIGDQERFDRRADARSDRRHSWGSDRQEEFHYGDDRNDKPCDVPFRNSIPEEFVPRGIDEGVMGPPHSLPFDDQFMRRLSPRSSGRDILGSPAPLYTEYDFQWHQTTAPFARKDDLPPIDIPSLLDARPQSLLDRPLGRRRLPGHQNPSAVWQQPRKQDSFMSNKQRSSQKTTRRFNQITATSAKNTTSIAKMLLGRQMKIFEKKPDLESSKESDKAKSSEEPTTETTAPPKTSDDTVPSAKEGQIKEGDKNLHASTSESKPDDDTNIDASTSESKPALEADTASKDNKKEGDTASNVVKKKTSSGPLMFWSVFTQAKMLEACELQGFLHHKVLNLWTCYICDVPLKNDMSYRNHIASASHVRRMKELTQLDASNERMRIADRLRKLPFQSKVSLGELQVGPGLVYFCSMCGEGYACSEEDHQKSKRHLGYKTQMFHCDDCNLFFKVKKNFSKHKSGNLHKRMNEIRKEKMEKAKESSRKQEKSARVVQTSGNKGPSTSGTRQVAVSSAKTAPLLTSDDSNAKRPEGQVDDDLIGMDLVIPVSGYFCKCCSKFYNSKQLAKSNHCRTASHREKALIWYKSYSITKRSPQEPKAVDADDNKEKEPTPDDCILEQDMLEPIPQETSPPDFEVKLLPAEDEGMELMPKEDIVDGEKQDSLNKLELPVEKDEPSSEDKPISEEKTSSDVKETGLDEQNSSCNVNVSGYNEDEPISEEKTSSDVKETGLDEQNEPCNVNVSGYNEEEASSQAEQKCEEQETNTEITGKQEEEDLHVHSTEEAGEKTLPVTLESKATKEDEDLPQPKTDECSAPETEDDMYKNLQQNLFERGNEDGDVGHQDAVEMEEENKEFEYFDDDEPLWEVLSEEGGSEEAGNEDNQALVDDDDDDGKSESFKDDVDV